MYYRTLPTVQTWSRAIFPLSKIEREKKKKKNIYIYINYGTRCRSKSALGSAVHQFLMGVPDDEC